ncbi:MAG: 3'(2'),5'-bisphosphate nucleotidase CysQ [Rubrivivax sp.]|nr:3'(2'),5'-bisphosphate nucleotidase CysQ [Rubrivivax sp.]
MAEGVDRARLLAEVERIAYEAGALILEVYGSAFAVEHKDDRSPVTLADRRAEDHIVPALQALLPGVPVVAEEAVSDGHAPDVSGGRFWLVDPLDGTREFVRRNGEFTVNIALVEAGEPVLGVIWAPALSRLFSGLIGQGAWGEDAGPASRRALDGRAVPAKGATVASSRSHGLGASEVQRWLPGHLIVETRPVGSSLKFGLLAAGEADIYPRPGRTMEWDTAAGQALLTAAGGCVLDLASGLPLGCGKRGFENPGFVALGRRPLAA